MASRERRTANSQTRGFAAPSDHGPYPFGIG